jgi:hypothetical protein
MNAIPNCSLEGASLVLSAILLSMPLFLINVALAGCKCHRPVTFTIHATVLFASLLAAVVIMFVDLPAHIAESLGRWLPLALFLQTVVLFFRRDQSRHANPQ